MKICLIVMALILDKEMRKSSIEAVYSIVTSEGFSLKQLFHRLCEGFSLKQSRKMMIKKLDYFVASFLLGDDSQSSFIPTRPDIIPARFLSFSRRRESKKNAKDLDLHFHGDDSEFCHSRAPLVIPAIGAMIQFVSSFVSSYEYLINN